MWYFGNRFIIGVRLNKYNKIPLNLCNLWKINSYISVKWKTSQAKCWPQHQDLVIIVWDFSFRDQMQVYVFLVQPLSLKIYTGWPRIKDVKHSPRSFSQMQHPHAQRTTYVHFPLLADPCITLLFSALWIYSDSPITLYHDKLKHNLFSLHCPLGSYENARA